MFKNILLALSATLALISLCPSNMAAQSTGPNVDSIRLMTAPADKALVFIIRDKMYGGAVPFRVECDGIRKGKNFGKRFLYFTCPAGTHTILSGGEATDEVVLQLEAGKTYYFRQIPKMGIAAARSALERIDDIKGKELLAKTKLSGNCTECGTDKDSED